MRRPHVGNFAVGLVFGAITAVALAVAGGMIYSEGKLGCVLALVGASLALALIYDESPQRWVLALYAALLVSSFIMLSDRLRGGVDGTMVLAVAVVAVALPIGFDLVLSD